MSEFKPGDTVDPRTLPVGAEFSNGSHRYRVTAPGMCRCINAPGTEGPILSYLSALISLPQPIADEVVELGTLRLEDHCVKDGGSVVLRVVRLLDRDGDVQCENQAGERSFHKGWEPVRRVPAPTAQKRPPCDACGEESCPNIGAPSIQTYDHPEFGNAHLCYRHWKMGAFQLNEELRARRAKQTSTGSEPSPSSAQSQTPELAGPRNSELVVSSLPTYDQIAGWLGAEWVAMGYDFRWEVGRHVYADPLAKHPLPWFEDFDCVYRCYLKHTSGQRVEVTAPSHRMLLTSWMVWFAMIVSDDRGGHMSDFRQHVRWLDPDTKTITIKPRNLCSQCGSNPYEILTQDRKELCGRCFNKRSVVEREPSHQRWSTTDPARIAALEAILAEQVRSGGQDSEYARGRVEAREAELSDCGATAAVLEFGRHNERIRTGPNDAHFVEGKGITAGPMLERYELPAEQRRLGSPRPRARRKR